MFHVEHLPGVCHAANSAGVNDGGKARRSLQGAASPTPRGGCGRLPVNVRYRASVRGGVKTPPYRWGSLRCRGDHWSPANLPQQRIFRDSFLQGKRARASNARPYKSFSTARQCTGNGRLWETRGPGMPGPYRAAAKKRTPTQPSRRGSAAESLPLTPSPQTPLLPPSHRSPPFPPYRRC